MKKIIILIIASLFLFTACSHHSVDTSNASRVHAESYVQGLHHAAKNQFKNTQGCEDISCDNASNGYQQGLKDGT
jgi:hypothetical protein